MKNNSNVSSGSIRDIFAKMKPRAVPQKTSNSWTTVRRNPSFYFTDTERITSLVNGGDPDSIIELSRFFFDTNGLYRRIILYFSTMLTYDTFVVPKFLDKVPDKESFTRNFSKVLAFLDSSNLMQELSRIVTVMLIEGAYYGLIYNKPLGGVIFADLPRRYCRTRFRSNNGNQLLEFDVTYFTTIVEEDKKRLILDNFPESIREFYNAWKEGKTLSSWYLCQEDEAVAFVCELDGNSSTYSLPFFAQIIPSISRFKDYEKVDLEAVQNELRKLIINKIPLDKEGELLFDLEEVKEIHNGVAEMLKDNEHVDVVTTFCDTEVASLGSSNEAVRSDLESISQLVYSEAGISKQLFNNTSAVSINYSIQNDLALVINLIKPIENWLTFTVNRRFNRNEDFFYGVSILPISHYNRGEMSKLYLQGAQYGYSKFLAGVSLGIKQSDLIALTTIEEDFFDLTNRMTPLQSSHTMTTESGPQKPIEELSPETIENKESS